MTVTQKLLVSVGALSLAILLWRIDLGLVKLALSHVGWGMVFIVGQELVAHGLNALGWRWAFSREDARAFSLAELVRLRVAGDAVNYLTPTATIGGEVVRTAMLSHARGADVRMISVIVAKATQTLAQALFITAGLALGATQGFGSEWFHWLLGAALAVGLAIAVVGTYMLKARGGVAATWRRAVGARVTTFLRDHPGRVALSTLMFALGYAWGAFEAFWICRFLMLPVPILTAAAIEILSITVDGILFMIPAKIGTQEGGKVAVFAALGLPASLGFAFGVVRHVRELVWGGLGLLLYWAAVGGVRLPPGDTALGRTIHAAPHDG